MSDGLTFWVLFEKKKENKNTGMTSRQESAPAAATDRSAEIDAELEAIPLFATHAPARGAMNERFQALSCVMEESTPDERALGLREQGNASFRRANGVGVRDAVDCYTRSLAVRGVADARIHAVTRLNRAAAHLRLGNYGSALADCDAALAVDPRLRKAHYRAADALRHLGRPAAALQHCDTALADLTRDLERLTSKSKEDSKEEEEEKEGKDKEKEEKDKEEEKQELEKDIALFKVLRDECEKAQKEAEAAAAAREAAGGCQYAEIERDAAAELARRGVVVGEPLVDTAQLAAQAQGALVTRLVDVVDGASDRVVGRALALPVVLLYEEAGVVDCVAAFPETRPLAQLLAEVLAHPPAWDTHRHYRRHTVEMYVELRRAPRPRLARLKPTSTLAALLAHPQYVLPRMPVISIVSTASKAFRKAFLAKYA